MVLDDPTARQFAAMGAQIDTSLIVDAKEEEDVFEVWACNWEAVTAFLAAETQWRVAVGFGAMCWLGLDYAAADVAFRRLGISDEAFAGVQVMERAALAVFAEEAV